MNHLTPLAATYDPLLVLLSIAVAILASYTALELSARFGETEGLRRSILLAASALTMGGGIWAMHFIGMLAFSIGAPVSYGLWLTLLSLALPIVVSGIGFKTIWARGMSPRNLVAAGLIMGGGIVLMHYTGMTAMQMEPALSYRPGLVAASILIAIFAATAALWFAFRVRITWQRLGGAVIMGAAISGMHYTGMAAARFHEHPMHAAASGTTAGIVLDQTVLGIVIAAATATMLAIALIWSFVERRSRPSPEGADILGGDASAAPTPGFAAALGSVVTPRVGLLLMVLFFATVVSVSWGLLAWTDYDETMSRTRVATRNTAQLIEEHVKRTIGEADVILKLLKRQVEAGGIEATESWRTRMLGVAASAAHLGPLTVTDASGRVLLTSGNAPAGMKPITEQPYFRAHRDNSEPDLIVSLDGGREQDRPFFNLSRRIDQPDGGFGGVVVISLYTDYFTSFYRSLDLGAGSVVAILRSDGLVLVREPPLPAGAPENLAASPLFAERLPQAPTGTYDSLSPVDGVGRILSYRQLEGFPVVVLASIARPTALYDWRFRLYRNSALAIGVFAAAVGLSWLALAGIQREDSARAALRRANAALDRRVQERTAQLETALGDKDALLREVHHRVKNNLQMIQALVRMTAARAPDEAQEAFADITRRIWAIGQVHNQVYGSPELVALDLAEYLARLAENVVAGFPEELERIKLDERMEHLDVDIDRALPIGLIVVELLTNAFKHAFPEGRAGTVRLQLATRNDSAELAISDDGVGMPPDAGTSMGLTLVNALVNQIEGRLEARRDGGTTFVLTFPAGPYNDADRHAAAPA